MNIHSNHEVDPTYILGSKEIDAITMTETILDFVNGYMLINYNKIKKLDHHGFIVNIALEEYFGVQ